MRFYLGVEVLAAAAQLLVELIWRLVEPALFMIYVLICKSSTFLYNSLKKTMFNIHFQPILCLLFSSKYIYHLEEGDVDEGGIEVDELKGNISEVFFF